jgi:hypothetical protein
MNKIIQLSQKQARADMVKKTLLSKNHLILLELHKVDGKLALDCTSTIYMDDAGLESLAIACGKIAHSAIDLCNKMDTNLDTVKKIINGSGKNGENGKD